VGQERKPRSERKCDGMNPHTPKGASTLGVGVPVDSSWTPQCLESNCRGQNPMDPGVFYTIGKLLKLRFLKCAHMTHLDI